MALTARYALCHSLAIEIISAKLVYFLNAGGHLNHFIYLSKPMLADRFVYALNGTRGTIKDITDNSHLSVLLGVDYLSQNKTYPIDKNANPSAASNPMSFNRYSTAIYEKFADNKLEIDKLRDMYFSLCDIKARQDVNDPLHLKAKDLIAGIEQFCKADVFNEDAYRALKVRYLLLQRQQRQAESPRSPVNNISMQVLHGFLTALGIAAVAIAFTVLSPAVIGAYA